jgi:peptide/nickel transport system substrate-binding protein
MEYTFLSCVHPAMTPMVTISWGKLKLLRSRRTTVCALALAALLQGCADPVHDRGGDALVIAQETQAAWTRNFNPFLPNGATRWPTRGGIYEPLLVYNRVAGVWVPWLAEAWEWEDDGRTLRFHVRSGVRWSDGEPFTADDVAFTFTLMKTHPALDSLGVWGWLASVETRGDNEVVFRLARPFSPGLEDLAEAPIVPRHVWEGVADPLAWENPEPVATGPYTEVVTFTTQVWELGRNPDYWQPGKPAIPTLRFPAFAGNDAANLALVNGEVDWAGNFVPAVERTFVERDPAHHLAWSPTVEATVCLFANTTVAPFGDTAVREALSLAIDRERLVTVAMDGLTHPSDATGLSDALAPFRDPTVTAAWTSYDPVAAGRRLDAAGYPLRDGARVGPDGPLAVDLLVVSGWSDWIRAAQLVARDLGAVGVAVRVRPVDFSGWLDRVQRGDFTLTIGWSSQGATPYATYRDLMGSQSARPIGEAAGGNWHRHASPAADRLLAAVEATSDPEAQAALFDQLQATFAAELPAIPLFPAPAWGVANTRLFAGFPTPEDPWVALSPNRPPEPLLILTTLEPR